MATSNERLVSASLTNSLSTLYTVPADKKASATGVIICNNGSVARLVTLKYAGKFIFSSYSMAAKETLALSVPAVLYETETIQGSQDSGTDVDVTISGIEEDVP